MRILVAVILLFSHVRHVSSSSQDEDFIDHSDLLYYDAVGKKMKNSPKIILEREMKRILENVEELGNEYLRRTGTDPGAQYQAEISFRRQTLEYFLKCLETKICDPAILETHLQSITFRAKSPGDGNSLFFMIEDLFALNPVLLLVLLFLGWVLIRRQHYFMHVLRGVELQQQGQNLEPPQREDQKPHQQPPQCEDQEPSQQELRQPPQREHQEPSQWEHRQPPQREHQEPSQWEHRQPAQCEHQEPSQQELRQPPQHEHQEPSQRELRQPPQREHQEPYQWEHRQPPQREHQEPPQYEHQILPQAEDQETCNSLTLPLSIPETLSQQIPEKNEKEQQNPQMEQQLNTDVEFNNVDHYGGQRQNLQMEQGTIISSLYIATDLVNPDSEYLNTDADPEDPEE